MTNSNNFNAKVASNSFSNLNSNSNASVSSKSAVLSSSSNANSNVSPVKSKKQNKAKGSLVPLSKRTKIHDVNDKDRDIYITEPNGTRIYAQLQQPSFRDARAISGSQYSIKPNGNTGLMKIDTVDYDTHLFSLFHNLTVNNRPAHMSWKFLDNQDFTTSGWLLRQAQSFLTNLYDTNN